MDGGLLVERGVLWRSAAGRLMTTTMDDGTLVGHSTTSDAGQGLRG